MTTEQLILPHLLVRLDANEFHWHMLMDPVHVLVNPVQLPIKAVTKEFHMINDGHVP